MKVTQVEKLLKERCWLPEADLEGDHHLGVVHLNDVAIHVGLFDADVDVDGNLDVVDDDDDERLAHLVDVAHVQLAVNSQRSWLVGLWSLVVLRKK